MRSASKVFLIQLFCLICSFSQLSAEEKSPDETQDFSLTSEQNGQIENRSQCFLCENCIGEQLIKNPSASNIDGTDGFCDQCFEEVFNSSIEAHLDKGDIHTAMHDVLKNIKSYQTLYAGLSEKVEHLNTDAETLDSNQLAKNIADATSDSLGVLGSLAGIAGGVVLMTIPGGQIAAPFGIASGIASASSLILKGSSSVIINRLNKVPSRQYEWLIIGTKSAETKVYGQLLSIDKWLAYQKLKKWDGNSEFSYTSVFGQILSPQIEDHAGNTLPMILSGVVKLSDAVFNWRSMKAAASSAGEAAEQLTSTSVSSIAAISSVSDETAVAMATQLSTSVDEPSKVLTNSSSIASGAASSANMVVSNYQWLLGGFGCIASIVGLASYSKNLYRSGSNVLESKKSKTAEGLRTYSQTIDELKAPKFFFEKFASIESRALSSIH